MDDVGDGSGSGGGDVKHRAGSTAVAHGRGDLDAETVEFARLATPGSGRRRLAATGGVVALGVAGLLAGVSPYLHPTTTAPTAAVASAPAGTASAPVVVPAPGGLDLGAAGSMASDATGDSDHAISSTDAGLPVPGGVVGLTAEAAMDRFRAAGFPYVQFINSTDGNLVVPSAIFRVTSVPSAGRTADPDVSLVVRVSEISTAPTPQERAASDRASAR